MEYDTSFIREGRPLGDWLLDAVSHDKGRRDRAGEVMMAMRNALPSIHTDLDDLDGERPATHLEDWGKAIAAALAVDGFPCREFFVKSAAYLIGAQEQWVESLNINDSQYDRVLGRLEHRIEQSESEDERKQHLRRVGRAMCAEIQRAAEQEPDDLDAFSMLAMVLPDVFEYAGAVLLEFPEAIEMLRESPSHQRVADKALIRLGPRAAGMYLEDLRRGFQQAGEAGDWYGQIWVLAEVGRGDPQTVELFLDALSRRPQLSAMDAASGLHEMGADALVRPRVIADLIDLAGSKEVFRRAAAARALGGVARGRDEAVDTLLALTHDTGQTEGDSGHLVAGCALTALGEIGRQPDRVVPRLVELLEVYEEFDCDMGYGGGHARICKALEEFGHAAEPVLPWVAKYLESWVDRDMEHWYSEDVLQLLCAIGPKARVVLPNLEKLDQAWQVYIVRADAEEQASWEQFEDDDDDEYEDEELDAEPEESPFARVILTIRQQMDR
ncbi:MAG: hypothetical protein AAGJ83_15255, partial [Planctomycetota bacterium]